MRTCVCSHVQLWLCWCRRVALQLMWGIMQMYCSLWHSQTPDYKPHTNVVSLCCLYYTSLSSTYEVIQHVPLSFALPLLCFSMSQHASMSAALPTGFWFMNPILVCHYHLQKGALMDQYVESVTRRIVSCPQTSWIFFWQPVACGISDSDDILEDDTLKCYKTVWVILFQREIHFFGSYKSDVSSGNISVAVITLHALFSIYIWLHTVIHVCWLFRPPEIR